MRQEIQFLDRIETLSFIPIAEAWKLKARCNLFVRWFMRLLLRRYCEQAVEPSVKVTRVLIDGETFMDKLFKQQRAIINHFTPGQEPKVLLIGASDYAEMMDTEIAPQMFNFRSSFHYRQNGADYVCGMRIQVIPWMSGLLVMPENQND